MQRLTEMQSLIKMQSSQARAIALRSQGLGRLASFESGVLGALSVIEHLGYVQIDTISVVERAHHHILWSRLPNYSSEWLGQLHAQRRVFEYWSHARAFLPMRDFRQSLPLMRSFRHRFHWSDDSPELRRAMRRVLGRIRSEGPLRARDFNSGEVRAAVAWTFGKIEKRALHELWMRGDIMVASREGFQKSYDLTERVLPETVDRSLPTRVEAADFLIERTLQAHGVVREAEFSYLRDGVVAAAIQTRLAHAIKRGRVVSVTVGDSSRPAYVLAETFDHPPGASERREVQILSPFDNLVIQRERLRWLFEFDYQLECYTPAAKRRYGYFVLPVLWGDRFVARLEAKADRARSRLLLQGIWFEPGYKQDQALRKAVRTALHGFALFNRCDQVDDASLSRAD